MNNLKLVPFHTAKPLLDLMAVGDGGDAYLITVEHLYQMSQAWLGSPTERTLWRFWDWDTGSQRFRQLFEQPVSTPTARAAAASLSGQRLVALLELNQQHAGYLGAWTLTTRRPPRISEAAPATQPIDLSEGEAQQVRLTPDEEWSSAILPAREWLFNPSVAASLGGDEWVIAMNTADARAVVWQVSGISLSKKLLAFVPDALEPAVCSLGSRRLLFYRKATRGWSVFFHALRYSGAYGPVPLPLVVADLGDRGETLRERDLSKGSGLGDTFSFSVSSGSEGRLILAVVSGSKEKPELRIYLSKDLGEPLQQLVTLSLPEMPYRTVMAASVDSAVIGVAYKRPDGYHISGLTLPLDR